MEKYARITEMKLTLTNTQYLELVADIPAHAYLGKDTVITVKGNVNLPASTETLPKVHTVFLDNFKAKRIAIDNFDHEVLGHAEFEQLDRLTFGPNAQFGQVRIVKCDGPIFFNQEVKGFAAFERLEQLEFGTNASFGGKLLVKNTGLKYFNHEVGGHVTFTRNNLFEEFGPKAKFNKSLLLIGHSPAVFDNEVKGDAYFTDAKGLKEIRAGARFGSNL